MALAPTPVPNKPNVGLFTAGTPVSAANSAVQPMLPPGGTGTPPKPTGMPQPGQPQQPAAQPVPDTSVAGMVQDITSQDSPLMQQARTDALKMANRRGLLNSSIAVGAGQESVIRAALPIASQDSAQAFQKGEAQLNRDLDLKMQGNQISAAHQQQIRQIASTEGLAAAERALQQVMQGKEIASREKMTSQQLALEEKMQGKALDAAKQQQIRDIASREGLAAAERALQLTMQGKEIAASSAEAKLDRGLQEKIASWNLSANDRNAAAQFITNMESMYQQQYQSIMNNTALSADQRTQQLNSAKALRDRQLDMVQQMYDVKLDWGQAKPAAPGTPTAPTNPTSNPEYAKMVKNPDYKWIDNYIRGLTGKPATVEQMKKYKNFSSADIKKDVQPSSVQPMLPPTKPGTPTPKPTKPTPQPTAPAKPTPKPVAPTKRPLSRGNR